MIFWLLTDQSENVVTQYVIAELGNTMPEDLPTVESVKKLEREQKKRLASGKQEKSEE